MSAEAQSFVRGDIDSYQCMNIILRTTQNNIEDMRKMRIHVRFHGVIFEA